MKQSGRAVLLGQIRDTPEPVLVAAGGLPLAVGLRRAPDRAALPGTPWFLKRKFLNTSNAKNFLAGSLVDQAYYFDEIAEKVRFPELFPCALASCALLEKAWSEGHDFMADPMVYVAHAISVDRGLAGALRSNDDLHVRAANDVQHLGARPHAEEACRKLANQHLQKTAILRLMSVLPKKPPLGLAPTASTTATLAMGDALAVVLLDKRGFKAEEFACYHPGGSLGKRLLLHVRDIMHSGDAVPKVSEQTLIKDAIYEISSNKDGDYRGAGFIGQTAGGGLGRGPQAVDGEN